jgi:hypothetical protein
VPEQHCFGSDAEKDKRVNVGVIMARSVPMKALTRCLAVTICVFRGDCGWHRAERALKQLLTLG